MEQFARECSRDENVTHAITQRFAPSSRGCGVSRGDSVSRSDARKGKESVVQQLVAKASLRAYVVWTWEESDVTDVIVAIFLLFFAPVYVLIDSGSSHLYMNVELVKSRSLKLEMSKVAMFVSSPLGQTVFVDQVCRRCPLKIQSLAFSVDLLIMPFTDFDLILVWIS